MAKRLPTKRRGEVEINIDGQKTILRATFNNIAAYEELTQVGMYQMAAKFGAGDIRMSQIINLIWIFSEDRDEEGWSQDEIAEMVMAAGPDAVVAVIEGFLSLLFGMEALEEAATNTPTDGDEDKKK
jgi:hypothetical protein